MALDRENIRFNVLRNALYHTGRRLALERYNRWCNFAIILLGAAGMSDMARLEGVDGYQAYVGLAVAVIGAAQLVFDFGGKARDHQSLQRDYYHLLAEIEEDLTTDEAQLARWHGQMVRIAGDEPPILRALDAKAYNDAIDASGYYDRSERLHIPFWHKLFAAFLSFEGTGYDTLAEVAAKKAARVNRGHPS
jgi:hypothetical protein